MARAWRDFIREWGIGNGESRSRITVIDSPSTHTSMAGRTDEENAGPAGAAHLDARYDAARRRAARGEERGMERGRAAPDRFHPLLRAGPEQRPGARPGEGERARGRVHQIG